MGGYQQHHSTNEYKLIMCNLCTLNLTPSFRSEIHAEIGLKSFCVAVIISVSTYMRIYACCVSHISISTHTLTCPRASERVRVRSSVYFHVYEYVCVCVCMMLLCCTVSPKFIVRSSKLYADTHTSPKHYLSSTVDSATAAAAAAVVTASESI